MTMISSWKKILILMNGGGGRVEYDDSDSAGRCCEDEESLFRVGSVDVLLMPTEDWEVVPLGKLPTRERG